MVSEETACHFAGLALPLWPKDKVIAIKKGASYIGNTLKSAAGL